MAEIIYYYDYRIKGLSINKFIMTTVQTCLIAVVGIDYIKM